MRFFSTTVVLMLFAVLPVPGQDETQPSDSTDAAAPAPTAAELVNDVIMRLPQDPITISGDLIVRKRRGVVIKELKFDMSLNWGAKPATAVYQVRDAFGKELEQLKILRPVGENPRFEYALGSPPVATNVPDLSISVQGADISWMDLTLSFLWWKPGSIVRTEEVLGRNCYVVDVSAPPGQVKQYSGALLWIDEKVRMLLQAEAYDSNGKPARRLWIKSIKKINDRWMIKDMEVQGSSPLHRTKLVIRELGTESEVMSLDKAAGE